jgi:ribosome maturation factor RimP
VGRQVAELIGPVLQEMGFELVDVKFFNSRGSWILRISVDKEEGGVTLDDCARVSGEIGDLIDVKDVIDHRYVLEVSSPGLDRPLTKERDFSRAVGKKIKVKTRAPIDGRRNFTGTLLGLEEGRVMLALDQGRVSIPLTEVEKARLVYDFGNP